MGLALLRGRFISEQDGPDSLPIVVVNQTLAQRYFAQEEPLGQKLRLGGDSRRYTIVGVVKDVKFFNLGDHPMNQSYTAFAQSPGSSVALVLRTTAEPTALSPALQSAVWSLDKEQPLSDVEPLEQRVADEEAPIVIFTKFSSYFALVALFLAGIGIYGVMAYLVESRSREIGIRVACGANRHSILWLVLTGSMRLVLTGVLVGLLGAWSIARLLMSQVLHGVTPNDLGAYGIAVAVLCGAVLFASFIPARRATRVDPLTVLRCE